VPADAGRFVSPPVPVHGTRVYGGRIVAEGMVAAAQTAPVGFAPQAVHVQFLRPGALGQEIRYDIETLRDGRSVSSRFVRATQGESLIATLTVSLGATPAHPLRDHEHGVAMPDVPSPEELSDEYELRQSIARTDPTLAKFLWPRDHPIELRPVDLSNAIAARSGDLKFWFRARPSLPAGDKLAGAALLAYASDRFVMRAACIPQIHMLHDHSFIAPTLNHSLWLHRDAGPEDWFLSVVHFCGLAGERAFLQGRIFARDGRHMATTAQEGLLRVLPVSASATAQ